VYRNKPPDCLKFIPIQANVAVLAMMLLRPVCQLNTCINHFKWYAKLI